MNNAAMRASASPTSSDNRPRLGPRRKRASGNQTPEAHTAVGAPTAPATPPARDADEQFDGRVMNRHLKGLKMGLAVKKQLPPDVLAFFKAQGAKGGRIGGKRALETMTPAQRVAGAKKASAVAAQRRSAKKKNK